MPGPALLHRQRSDPRIQRPGRERRLQRGRDELRTQVVEICLQDDERLARGRRLLAENRAKQVRSIVPALRAGPVSRPSYGHRGQRVDGLAHRREERGAGRRGPLARAARPDRAPAQDLEHGRSGNGDRTVPAPHRSAAGGRGQGDDAAGIQHGDEERSAQHVDDGIERAHLVQLDLVRRDAVDPALRLGEALEGSLRQRLRPRRKRGSREQVADLAVGPVVRLALPHRVRDLDGHVQGGDAVDLDRSGNDPQRAQVGVLGLLRERRDSLVERCAGSPEVEERRDQHVARDSSDRLEGEDGQRSPLRMAPRAMSAAWNPAENPLSMFTTETLAAQELSMAKRAARPPREAP